MVPEQIQKAVWNIKENIKDTVDKSISQAIQQKLLLVDASQAAKIVEITKNAVEEGYHAAFRGFLKTTDDVIAVEVSKEAKKLLKK